MPIFTIIRTYPFLYLLQLDTHATETSGLRLKRIIMSLNSPNHHLKAGGSYRVKWVLRGKLYLSLRCMSSTLGADSRPKSNLLPKPESLDLSTDCLVEWYSSVFKHVKASSTSNTLSSLYPQWGIASPLLPYSNPGNLSAISSKYTTLRGYQGWKLGSRIGRFTGE